MKKFPCMILACALALGNAAYSQEAEKSDPTKNIRQYIHLDESEQNSNKSDLKELEGKISIDPSSPLLSKPLPNKNTFEDRYADSRKQESTGDYISSRGYLVYREMDDGALIAQKHFLAITTKTGEKVFFINDDKIPGFDYGEIIANGKLKTFDRKTSAGREILGDADKFFDDLQSQINNVSPKDIIKFMNSQENK